MEKAGNVIGKVVDSINTLVKRLVESFDGLMKKNKTDQVIKKLEKLPKDAKVNIGVDIDEAGKTYTDLLDEYSSAINNPKKSSKIKDKTERAKSRRKKILIASTVTVGVILYWLKLLKDKNNFKNYKLVTDAKLSSLKIKDINNDMYERNTDEYGRKIPGAVLRRDKSSSALKHYMRSKNEEEYQKDKRGYQIINDSQVKEANKVYIGYLASEKALQESEYYRLIIYKNIFKSIKNIGKFVKGTVEYGIKGSKSPKTTDDDVSFMKGLLKEQIKETNKTGRSRLD